MGYQIYSLNSVLYFLYQARSRRSQLTKVVFYKINFGKGRCCIILYEPDSYHNVQHLSFYALSTGWNKVTETGFKSLFIQFSNIRGGKTPSFQEMESYWKAYCNELGLVVGDESNQMGLF